jgi:hypothetical protein
MPISIVFERNYQPFQANPIDLFSNKFPSKHAKVSHSSIFLSTVAREGFPFSLFLLQPLNIRALVFQVCQKGVSTETMETYLDPPSAH